MSQPEDEETKEHPAYPQPVEPQPVDQPVAPMPPSPPMTPPMTPPQAPSLPFTPPVAPSSAPLPVTPPVTPTAGQTWQQPASPAFQPPAVPAWQPPAPPQYQPPTASQWQQPTPQGWQQPGGQPWQQPAPPGWQQPGPYPPQPGWVAQPQWPTGPRYSTSALVAVAGLLLVLFGLIDAVGGVWLLGQGSELRGFIQRSTISFFGPPIDRETMRALISPLPAILLVFGAIEVLAGAAIFAHKGWARAIGILVSLLGLIVGVVSVSFSLALSPGASVPMVASIAVVLGYAFMLVALVAGGRHFRDRYSGAPGPR